MRGKPAEDRRQLVLMEAIDSRQTDHKQNQRVSPVTSDTGRRQIALYLRRAP